MNNFDIGRAIVDQALRLARGRSLSQAAALSVLDRACTPWRGETAEFESQDPGKPGCVHPDYDDDCDPIAPFGGLLRQAFWPQVADEDWKKLVDSWCLAEEEMDDAAWRLQYEWYLRTYAFKSRYGFFGFEPSGPLPFMPRHNGYPRS